LLLAAQLDEPAGRGAKITILGTCSSDDAQSSLGRKEICVDALFSTIQRFLKHLEELILPLTCVVLLAWTAYELIKKKIGF
jgi:hypothetical protein